MSHLSEQIDHLDLRNLMTEHQFNEFVRNGTVTVINSELAKVMGKASELPRNLREYLDVIETLDFDAQVNHMRVIPEYERDVNFSLGFIEHLNLLELSDPGEELYRQVVRTRLQFAALLDSGVDDGFYSLADARKVLDGLDSYEKKSEDRTAEDLKAIHDYEEVYNRTNEEKSA